MFCGIMLPIPNMWNDYLAITYGDYNEIPSIDSIKRNQHSSFWDTKNDFTKYCPNIKDFSDERRGMCRK